MDTLVQVITPKLIWLVYAGVPSNTEFAGSGPSGSGYYERVKRRGSYYGTILLPGIDDSGHSGSLVYRFGFIRRRHDSDG